MHKVLIRKALVKDVQEIHELLSVYADQKIVLPRKTEEIRKHIRCFCVAEIKGKIAACCAYRDYGKALYEIRSLAVHPDYVGGGIGTKIVAFMLEKLMKKGHVRIFALTMTPAFFKKFGFKTVPKELFPEKIWSDCSKCPKLHNCDEEALLVET